jgi:hypothetical protein
MGPSKDDGGVYDMRFNAATALLLLEEAGAIVLIQMVLYRS